jgi:hypothetical protein
MESFVSEVFQKDLNMIVSLFMLANPQAAFTMLFTLLCPSAKLLTTYYISITRYLATLYRIWCSYHSYVIKVINVRILWHHIGPFGSLSCHSSYFFKAARPSLSGLTCCPCLFRMLSFDHSCISFLFLVKWSPYSSWCDGTCKDQYLSLPGHTMGYSCVVTWSHPITCLAFQKFSSAILSSNIIFFDGRTTRVEIYFTFTRCSFGCCANTFLLLCRSNNRVLVISSS